MNAVAVSVSKKQYSKLAARVKRIAARTLAGLKKKNLALEVYLISDGEMKALNRLYRRKNKPTNVLSFENRRFPAGPKGQIYLGEVFLAPDYVRRRGEDPDLLVIHGLLHLLGYTHEKSRDRIKMERLEDKFLSVFARK